MAIEFGAMKHVTVRDNAFCFSYSITIHFRIFDDLSMQQVAPSQLKTKMTGSN